MESLGYLVTISGFMGGLNPCSLGLMMMFLGYLMIFGNKKKRSGEILVLGGFYLLGVVMTYLLLGLVFYRLAYGLQRSVWLGMVKYVLAIVIFGFGLLQIVGKKIEMPKKMSRWFSKLMKRVGKPAAVLTGGLTAIVSAPCTLPVYVGTAMVLAGSGMSQVRMALYFLYYNLLFVLPLAVILGLVYKGGELMEMKEWSHKNERVLRLLGGLALLFLAWWVIK